MTLAALSKLAAVKKLTVGPGEALVVTGDFAPTAENASRIRRIVDQALPGVPVLVFGGGVKIAVAADEHLKPRPCTCVACVGKDSSA
jgi:calcineurin-like phosphoesterase family protein